MITDSYYILIDKNPVCCSDTKLWLKYQNDKSRVIDRTSFGEVEVSTVFLGWAHGLDNGLPILFETLVFGGEFDGHMQRYTSWDDAVKGHDEVCKMVNKVAIDRENKLNDLGL